MKKDMGVAKSPPPYGFDFDESGNLVENETEQVTLAKIRELKVSGFTTESILACLVDHGITKKGGFSES